ncbi:hypothetical protein scyTo_0003450 [Scyliorhinus torazame]|uniref:Peptidase A2 domain-containing protein n=1 Tax=Scyliorhinus torazame TaxID=75743 RepID=A0A401PMJ7_SCYTO|nr:hypothetical protein [Scyliorhinus torazame]
MINETSTVIKMDTGARANFINEADLKKVRIQPHIQPYNECSLTDYHGAQIKTLGKCTLQVEVNEQSHLVEFAVVEVNTRSLFSATACYALQLVQQLYDQDNDFFELNKLHSDYAIVDTEIQDTDTDCIQMVRTAAIDEKAQQTLENKSKAQATALLRKKHCQAATENMVGLEDRVASESVQQHNDQNCDSNEKRNTMQHISQQLQEQLNQNERIIKNNLLIIKQQNAEMSALQHSIKDTQTKRSHMQAQCPQPWLSPVVRIFMMIQILLVAECAALLYPLQNSTALAAHGHQPILNSTTVSPGIARKSLKPNKTEPLPSKLNQEVGLAAKAGKTFKRHKLKTKNSLHIGDSETIESAKRLIQTF